MFAIIFDLTTAVFLMVVGIALLQGDSLVPVIGPFNPQNTHDAQQKTFSPPIPNLDCSVYQNGTYWHFINSHTGRCCGQIFVINGTFLMCDTNGGYDQLVECPKDSYNWNNPYFSGRFQFPDEAIDLCGDNRSVDGLSSLSITWDYDNFIRPEGRSVVLRGTVDSSSDLKITYLFRCGDSVPLGEMKCRHLADEGIWLAEWKFENLTLDYGGFYSILAVNKQTSAWSREARLTVLPKARDKTPTLVSTSPSSTEKPGAREKTSTLVPTSPSSTEKPGGFGDGHYILFSLLVVVVVALVVIDCFVWWKTRSNTLKNNKKEEEDDNDEKDNLTEREGQQEIAV